MPLLYYHPLGKSIKMSKYICHSFSYQTLQLQLMVYELFKVCRDPRGEGDFTLFSISTPCTVVDTLPAFPILGHFNLLQRKLHVSKNTRVESTTVPSPLQ